MNERRIAKVCAVCGRFRLYDPDDRFCIVCGYEDLAATCDCGRPFDYALAEAEPAPLHCPRCGKDWRAPAPR